MFLNSFIHPFFCAGYELERRHGPGQPVDLNSTLESQRTLEFNLVKNVGKWGYFSLNISNLHGQLPLAIVDSYV